MPICVGRILLLLISSYAVAENMSPDSIKFSDFVCKDDPAGATFGDVECKKFIDQTVKQLKTNAGHIAKAYHDDGELHAFSSVNSLCRVSTKGGQVMKIKGNRCDIVGLGEKGTPTCGANYCKATSSNILTGGDDAGCDVEFAYKLGARIQVYKSILAQVISEVTSGTLKVHKYKDIRTCSAFADSVPLAFYGKPPKRSGLKDARENFIKKHKIKREIINATQMTEACTKDPKSVWKAGGAFKEARFDQYTGTAFCEMVSAFNKLRSYVQQLATCEFMKRSDEAYSRDFIEGDKLMVELQKMQAGFSQSAASGNVSGWWTSHQDSNSNWYSVPHASFNFNSALNSANTKYKNAVDAKAKSIIQSLAQVSNQSIFSLDFIKDDAGKKFDYPRCGEKKVQ